MYLSKIEVIGFKSFAQRVNLNFDAGMTAIVGPNGCGKTNIVDAIRWALGEQRYSTLRSDKMEDVIFNGTKNRKPLGLAEVSLTIENTKGILPTEYSEVTITRRVFRSGESEYLLNKVPCRLKDILDLFMDTGMGSDAYSVIELKMVETILSDKTDERRRLFEEAAGVTKYKFRRKAALRKLEDVQQDLARVNDIVKEVQKTVNSLERQAKKAEQYNEVNARLKSLEIDLLEREYAHLHSRLKPLEERFALAMTDRSQIDEALRQKDEQIDQLRLGLSKIEQQFTDAQRTVAAQFERIHRSEEKILVAEERRNSLTANVGRYEKEKTDLHDQQRALAKEQVILRERTEQLRTELTASEEVFGRTKNDHRIAGERLDAKKTDVQSINENILAVAHDLVEQRGEQERIKSHIDNLRGRIDRAREDVALYKADIEQDEAQVRQLTTQDKELRLRFAESEMQLVEREHAKQELKNEAERLQYKLLGVLNEVERKNSRINFLRRILESSEGFSEGAKHLLNSETWKQKKLTIVADVIHTDVKYRRAIEAALGEMANLLVVEKVEDGYAAIEELRQQDKGTVGFVCLEWVPKLESSRKKKSTLAWASDIVQCDNRHRPLIDFLLDGVLIVDSIEAAAKICSTQLSVRCVSLDGQVTTSTGVLRGGSRRIDDGGIIGKKAEIVELEHSVTLLQDEIQTLTSKRAQKLSEVEAFDVQSFADAVKSIEKEMTAIEMRIAQLEFEKKRANDAIERNTLEIRTLEQEITQLQRQHDVATTALASLEAKRTEQETLAATAQQELETHEIAFAEKTRAVNELEIKVLTLQGDLRNIRRDIERTDAQLNDIAVTLERRDTEIERAQEEIERLKSEVELHQKDLDSLRIEYGVMEQRKHGIEQSYGSHRSELHQLELKVKDERRLHEDAVSTVHELELKISEIKAQIEHVRLRAEEEFELNLQLKTYPDDEFVDFAALRDDVKNLKDRIRVLGAINFAAFDEFTSESERLSFLTQQRDDLIEAEKTLLSTIEEINNTAQRKFLETFMKIRENFILIFKELFMEGDECDLRLEENVDPLEAGIEIVAKPRGKRPTSIDLLSGGEKTLTAIALLFAIYLVKPSPFCILDEVDAPLDDSNIDRFTRILKKFSNNTQFIVVTHNKRTMEAAQALYGVTMEEEGISKIVTVRFNEEARVRSATVTS